MNVWAAMLFVMGAVFFTYDYKILSFLWVSAALLVLLADIAHSLGQILGELRKRGL